MVRLREIFIKHIKGNLFIYFLVIMFLIIGISAGAFTVKALTDSQKQELISYLNSFFQVLNQNNFEVSLVFKQALTNNLQTGILIWILGITVLGAPLILILVALRGFIIGFTVGFILEEMSLKGMIFAIFSLLPQNIFILPCILTIAVIGISFSIMIVKNRIQHSRNNDIFRQFIVYSSIIASLFLIIILGCIVEAYITPVFMRFISQYM